LDCNQAELVLFNPLRMIDALDETASTLKRFRSGGIMHIQTYAFQASAIKDTQLFKIPNLHPSPLFAGEEFVKHWHDAGLRGSAFRQIWEG
jgi:hypothetical protein